MILRRIARPMLASVFIVSGIDSVRNPTQRAKVAEGLVGDVVNALPDDVTDNVPTDAETLVRINGAIQVGGGVLLATGKVPRLAASALAGSLVPTTIAGHAFWEETDPQVRSAQRTQFLKNVGLLGGLLITAADTEGKPSLAWRSRQKAHGAGQAVSSALPIGAVAGAGAGASTWEALRDKAQEGAHVVGEKSSVAAGQIREHAPEIADKVKEKAPVIADAARERAGDIADRINDRAPEFADAARERAGDIADRINDRAPDLADAARERANDIADRINDRAPDLASSARSVAERATTKAQKAGDKATAKAQKAGDKAATKAQKAGKKTAARAEKGKRRWRKAHS